MERTTPCLPKPRHLVIACVLLVMPCLTHAWPLNTLLRGSRAGHGRNIRPLHCATTTDVGVCMFAFDCMNANGTHLTICMDRFYVGSCCKLKNSPPPFVVGNEIDSDIWSKPEDSAKPDSLDSTSDSASDSSSSDITSDIETDISLIENNDIAADDADKSQDEESGTANEIPSVSDGGDNADVSSADNISETDMNSNQDESMPFGIIPVETTGSEVSIGSSDTHQSSGTDNEDTSASDSESNQSESNAGSQSVIPPVMDETSNLVGIDGSNGETDGTISQTQIEDTTDEASPMIGTEDDSNMSHTSHTPDDIFAITEGPTSSDDSKTSDSEQHDADNESMTTEKTETQGDETIQPSEEQAFQIDGETNEILDESSVVDQQTAVEVTGDSEDVKPIQALPESVPTESDSSVIEDTESPADIPENFTEASITMIEHSQSAVDDTELMVDGNPPTSDGSESITVNPDADNGEEVDSASKVTTVSTSTAEDTDSTNEQTGSEVEETASPDEDSVSTVTEIDSSNANASTTVDEVPSIDGMDNFTTVEVGSSNEEATSTVEAATSTDIESIPSIEHIGDTDVTEDGDSAFEGATSTESPAQSSDSAVEQTDSVTGETGSIEPETDSTTDSSDSVIVDSGSQSETDSVTENVGQDENVIRPIDETSGTDEEKPFDETEKTETDSDSIFAVTEQYDNTTDENTDTAEEVNTAKIPIESVSEEIEEPIEETTKTPIEESKITEDKPTISVEAVFHNKTAEPEVEITRPPVISVTPSPDVSEVNVINLNTTTMDEIENSWNDVEIITTPETTVTSTSIANTTGFQIIFPSESTVNLNSTNNATLSSEEQEQLLVQRLKTANYTEICGTPVYPVSRIVGGFEAEYGEWPWQVSLRQWRSVAFLHKCGSALVNENWAITAAHCVEGIEPDQLLLVMGEYDLGTTDEPYGHVERTVQVIAMHPKFEPRTFEYDLALLRFSEPVTFQPNIIPICIPEDDENFLGKTGYVTGWGRLYEDGPLPTVMQKVPVPVIPNKDCEVMYNEAGYVEHIPKIFICAGYQFGKQDSCEGDSGGPLVINYKNRWRLAGIISWGIGCAVPNQPGVYTRISEFREWVNKIIIF